MLTKDLILSYHRGDNIFPKYIPFDAENLRPLEDALGIFADRAYTIRKSIEAALRDILDIHFVPKISQGFTAVILNACRFDDEAAVTASALRDELFGNAVKIWQQTQPDAFPAASDLPAFFAGRLGFPVMADSEALEEFFYPDIRKNRRLLEAPKLSATDVLNRYNIAQVQHLLTTAIAADITLHKADSVTLRGLLFALHHLGLVFYFTDRRKDSRVTLHIEGPTGLITGRRTYGFEFARILPEIISLRATPWELTAMVESSGGRQKKLRLDSKSGYLPSSALQERGVWSASEIDDFISRWNKQETDIAATRADTFFSDYSRVCRIPDIRLKDNQTGKELFIEWLRYPTSDFTEDINRSLEVIPQAYVFAYKAGKTKFAADTAQTKGHLLAFRSMIPLQPMMDFFTELTTNHQLTLTKM